jgi:hypothetical protein
MTRLDPLAPDAPTDAGDRVTDAASTRRLRFQAALAAWFPALVVALLVAAAAGAYGTYTVYEDPGTHAEERTVDEWTSTGEFAHRGLVTVENDIYEPGTVLSEQPFYLAELVSDLSGEFAYAYAGDGPEELTVRARTELVYREYDPEDGERYWERREPLGEREATLAPGEALSMPFYMETATTMDRLSDLEDQVGRLPVRSRTEVAVVATTRAVGAVGGTDVTERSTYELPYRFRQGMVEVTDPGPVETTHADTVTVRVANEYGRAAELGIPAALVVGLGGLGAALWARRTGRLALSPAERARLTFAATRRDLEEWITVGQAPEADQQRTVASLDGLVDLAADTNERVVEDADAGVFAVVHDGVRYEFHPPAAAVIPSATDPATGDTDPTGDDAVAIADGRGDPDVDTDDEEPDSDERESDPAGKSEPNEASGDERDA